MWCFLLKLAVWRILIVGLKLHLTSAYGSNLKNIFSVEVFRDTYVVLQWNFSGGKCLSKSSDRSTYIGVEQVRSLTRIHNSLVRSFKRYQTETAT